MVRFGVIGTGTAAEKFLSVTAGIREFRLAAVYSRDPARAKAFGQSFGAKYFYDDLDEFAKCGQVDAVYIASPNACHCSQAVLMLRNKKHVLCEKPLASNVREVKEMFGAAHGNGVVLLEAMRPVFAPEFARIRSYIKKLGKIRRASFCYNQYSSRYNNYKKGIVENAFLPELSKGALMDLGCYCIYPMVFFFGLPRQVTGVGAFLENGLDGAGTVLLDYGGMIGEARYSKVNDSILESEIQGEEASMILSGIASTRDMAVRYRNGFQEVVHFDQCDNNMEYEIRAFIEMVEGRRSPDCYEAASLHTAMVMEEARQQMGIRFPADKMEMREKQEELKAERAGTKKTAADRKTAVEEEAPKTHKSASEKAPKSKKGRKRAPAKGSGAAADKNQEE